MTTPPSLTQDEEVIDYHSDSNSLLNRSTFGLKIKTNYIIFASMKKNVFFLDMIQ